MARRLTATHDGLDEETGARIRERVDRLRDETIRTLAELIRRIRELDMDDVRRQIEASEPTA